MSAHHIHPHPPAFLSPLLHFILPKHDCLAALTYLRDEESCDSSTGYYQREAIWGCQCGAEFTAHEISRLEAQR